MRRDALRVRTGSKSRCSRSLDDFIVEDNPIRVADAFVGELSLSALGLDGSTLLVACSANRQCC